MTPFITNIWGALDRRVRTAAIVLPVLLAIIIFAPPTWFTGFILLVTAWALYEVVAMLAAGPFFIGLIALCGGVPAIELLARGARSSLAPALVILAMLLLTARVAEAGPLAPTSWLAIVGALWVGALFPYFAFLRNGPSGVAHTILMLLLVAASDTGAYYTGRATGRIKLLPKVSPHKTVEGALGGLVACVIAGLILGPLLSSGLGAWAMVRLAFAIAVMAQLGDLVNSAFKRSAGVKDSGTIFPGHGGLLDRACSLVFPAVLAYYYFR